MPPKNCGSCQKLVYPMDELKCLDKTWHKSCFRCQTCSMTLNMKNYKGYNKLPYCNAHYPTTKFTAVADTPEIKRIAKNTKIQSNVTYHAEFEAAKGQVRSVADDPETRRVRKNMETISNIAYHGDMIRKKEMENARPTEIEESSPPSSSSAQWEGEKPRRQPGSITDYDPTSHNRPYTTKTQATTVYNSTTNGQAYRRDRRIGSITDYDPINDQYGSIVGQYTASKPEPDGEQPVSGRPAPSLTPPIASQRNSDPASQTADSQPSEPPAQPTYEPPAQPSYEPPAQPSYEPEAQAVQSYTPEPEVPQTYDPEPEIPATHQSAPEVLQSTEQDTTQSSKGNMSKAIYAYTAGDDDEVSFEEDDIIINCEPIDEGWMYGTVEKSGQYGMLPANYVEKLNW